MAAVIHSIINNRFCFPVAAMIKTGILNMFDDLFDLGKRRTLKQSVGFFLFYTFLFLGVSTLIGLFSI